jgi:hypothetical protein
MDLIGPTNVGGRVTDVAIDVEVPDQVFIAAASGGVWKTTDGNATYETAWPDDLTQAVGALAMTPNGTLFAGTGETNPGGGSLTFGGTGMYRSRDRGQSWQHVGLARSGAFGRIVAHPRKSRILYAAAAGHLYLPGASAASTSPSTAATPRSACSPARTPPAAPRISRWTRRTPTACTRSCGTTSGHRGCASTGAAAPGCT